MVKMPMLRNEEDIAEQKNQMKKIKGRRHSWAEKSNEENKGKKKVTCYFRLLKLEEPLNTNAPQSSSL